jgi:hypothetical protein
MADIIHKAKRVNEMTARQRIQTGVPPRITPTSAVRAKTAADALNISWRTFFGLVGDGK